VELVITVFPRVVTWVITLLPTDAAAGGSDDYMKGVEGIDLSYTVEMTNTRYGFELPASQILQHVRQFFEGVRVFGKYVKDNFSAKA
jgi:hypothetical protein